MEWLVKYLYKTHPTRMTMQCHEALSMFLNSIVKDLWRKMETFRSYDEAPELAQPTKLVKDAQFLFATINVIIVYYYF